MITAEESAHGTVCGDTSRERNVEVISVVGMTIIRILIIPLPSLYWGPHMVHSIVAASISNNNDNDNIIID